MTGIVLTLLFPVGAFVMRKHFRSARGLFRIALYLLGVMAIVCLPQAAMLVLTAVLDAYGMVERAADGLDARPLLLAAAGGVALAALTIRRSRVITLSLSARD